MDPSCTHATIIGLTGHWSQHSCRHAESCMLSCTLRPLQVLAAHLRVVMVAVSISKGAVISLSFGPCAHAGVGPLDCQGGVASLHANKCSPALALIPAFSLDNLASRCSCYALDSHSTTRHASSQSGRIGKLCKAAGSCNDQILRTSIVCKPSKPVMAACACSLVARAMKPQPLLTPACRSMKGMTFTTCHRSAD